MSYGRMCEQEEKLEAEIKGLLAQAETVDAAEDAQHSEAHGYSLPDQLAHRQQRLSAIKAAKQRLEGRARQRAEEDQQRPPGSPCHTLPQQLLHPGASQKHIRDTHRPHPTADPCL